MDLTKELDTRLAGIPESKRVDGIKAAIRHIHMAERHLESGRAVPNPDLFNDVIYRTNQAFEGMLKEAYQALAKADGMKASPYQIEHYLEEEGRLPMRVLSLFQNYRQSWRNPATHDHTLLFKEQEAVLAIVSVSAFAVVLLDLVVELESARRAAESEAILLKGEDPSQSRGRLLDDLVRLLLQFKVDQSLMPAAGPFDSAVVGHLIGLVSGFDPEIKIEREPILDGGRRPDVVFRRGEDGVILELSGRDPMGDLRDGSIFQMVTYLDSGSIRSGIVFAPPREAHEINIARLVPFPDIEVVVIAPNLSTEEMETVEGFRTNPFNSSETSSDKQSMTIKSRDVKRNHRS